MWKVQQEASGVKPARGDVLLNPLLIPCKRQGIKVPAAAITHLQHLAWCRVKERAHLFPAPAGIAVLVQAVGVAGGCDSLWSLWAGSAGAEWCGLLSCPFMGVHLGVPCFKLCWMRFFAVMLGEHLLLKQMMVGWLLSDMWSCLQAFHHHPSIKGQML